MSAGGGGTARQRSGPSGSARLPGAHRLQPGNSRPPAPAARGPYRQPAASPGGAPHPLCRQRVVLPGSSRFRWGAPGALRRQRAASPGNVGSSPPAAHGPSGSARLLRPLPVPPSAPWPRGAAVARGREVSAGCLPPSRPLKICQIPGIAFPGEGGREVLRLVYS